MSFIERGSGNLYTIAENVEFLQYGNRISETEELFARLLNNNIIFVNNATSFSEMNFLYFKILTLLNIILMVITIIYYYKDNTNKNVYKIFLILDILFYCINIIFAFLHFKYNNNNYTNLPENKYTQQEEIVGYFSFNVIFTSITFYFIIDSLYHIWVDKGKHRKLLQWCISIVSILQNFLVLKLIYSLAGYDPHERVPNNVLEHIPKN